LHSNTELSASTIVSQSSRSATAVAETDVTNASAAHFVNPSISLGHDTSEEVAAEVTTTVDTTQVEKFEDLPEAGEDLDLNELEEEIQEGADEEDAGFDVMEIMTTDVYQKRREECEKLELIESSWSIT
jgi:hypothetical protein